MLIITQGLLPPGDEMKTKSILGQLLYHDELQEANLWGNQTGSQVKEEIKKKFRNTSALMDCVGCERCRLWGKLQFLGLAAGAEERGSFTDQPSPSTLSICLICARDGCCSRGS